jgi:hypothetical protein
MATYHITTPQQLQDMNNDLSGDYILENDIDLTGVEWTPIGYDDPFIGTFDGQNFTIRNLTYDDTGYNYNASLFAQTEEGLNAIIIKNLKLENFVLTGQAGIGVLIGYCNKINISNIIASNINVTASGYAIGCGLIAEMIGNASVVEDCSISNLSISISNMLSGVYDIGGLIGYVENCTIEGCSAEGEISLNSNDISSVGGLVGETDTTSFEKCYSDMSIETIIPSGTNSLYYIGGLIGNIYHSQITNCYSVGSLSGSVFYANADIYGVGGLIGSIDPYETTFLLQNCYSSCTLTFSHPIPDYSASVCVGGLVGVIEPDAGNIVTIQNCYSVGLVTASNGNLNAVGGLIGYVYNSDDGSVVFINCSWFVDGCDNAIGYYYDGSITVAVPLLITDGYGTDEPDNTKLYQVSHQVYQETLATTGYSADSTASYTINNGNPNGEWSYGRKWAVDTTIFELFPETGWGSFWWLGNSGDGSPSIQGPPVDLWAKSNENGYPCLRWTAPETAVYTISGSFVGSDSRGVDVYAYVVVNGATSSSYHITAYNQTETFDLGTTSYMQGDVIDFMIVSSNVLDPAYSWTFVYVTASSSGQQEIPGWDFTTPIWYAHEDKYPDFLPDAPSGGFPAVGYYAPTQESVRRLSTHDWGTDEPDNTKFYSKLHQVYFGIDNNGEPD